MSYIPVNPDYTTDAKKLADFLNYLDANDNKYAEFFWWKSHYQVVDPTVGWRKAWCKMCELLNTEGTAPPPHDSQADDIKTWWVTSSECTRR